MGVMGMQVLDLGVDRRILDRVPKQFPPLPLLLYQAPALEALGGHPMYGDISLSYRRII